MKNTEKEKLLNDLCDLEVLIKEYYDAGNTFRDYYYNDYPLFFDVFQMYFSNVEKSLGILENLKDYVKNYRGKSKLKNSVSIKKVDFCLAAIEKNLLMFSDFLGSFNLGKDSSN